MRRIVCLIVGLLVLFAMPVYAQATTCSANCSLVVGQAFQVQADHDGVNTDGYRVIIDGVQVGADMPLSALVAGVVTSLQIAAPARGTHTVGLQAFNVDGSALSNLVALTTKKAPPGKPNNPRILSSLTSPLILSALKHADGSVTLTLGN